MKKIEKFKKLLEDILLEIDNEKANPQSLWRLGEYKPDFALDILDKYQVKMSQGMRSLILTEPDSVLVAPIVGVVREITELLQYAQNGTVYFKYGKAKSQRMLQSTYFMLDTFIPLDKTLLGIKIFELQDLYRKL